MILMMILFLMLLMLLLLLMAPTGIVEALVAAVEVEESFDAAVRRVLHEVHPARDARGPARGGGGEPRGRRGGVHGLEPLVRVLDARLEPATPEVILVIREEIGLA